MPLPTTSTEILERRLQGWRDQLNKPPGKRYFTVGECERAISDIERELMRRRANTSGASHD